MGAATDAQGDLAIDSNNAACVDRYLAVTFVSKINQVIRTNDADFTWNTNAFGANNELYAAVNEPYHTTVTTTTSAVRVLSATLAIASVAVSLY